MTTERLGFADFERRVWLNCAHQGPLPLVAAEAARRAVAWKVHPWELTQERFDATPPHLKRLLGRLIHVPADQIILANGASYGLHLLANGLPLESGDEVLLMRGDFPSNLLPWLALRRRDIAVRMLEPQDHLLTVDEIEPRIGPRTRVLCMSWVHSFSGFRADLERIGALCRSQGVWFLVNTTQGLGAQCLDVGSSPVDAVTNAGWKWLCGPYGTGFCWLRPELLDELDYNKSYWLSTQTAADLGSEQAEPREPEGLGARRYDIFSTANFFNYVPWIASLEHLLEIGPEKIAERDRRLVAHFLSGLDEERYDVRRPRDAGSDEHPSTLLFVSHRQPERNRSIYEALLAAGIYPAFRRGRLRFSPHLYNTVEDLDRALQILHEAG